MGCASPHAVDCPNCGAPTEPGDRFCGECAAPIGAGRTAGQAKPAGAVVAAEPGRSSRASGAPSSASPPVAERRLVSVLFADLVGFTALSADRDPEETRELLSRYFHERGLQGSRLAWEFLKSLGSDELAGALAGHHLAAHRHAADPGQAGALAAQARIALSAAADRAIALGSHDQAIVFLRQALEVTERPQEQADLLERVGETVSVADRPGDAQGDLLRALELREAAGDRRGAAR